MILSFIRSFGNAIRTSEGTESANMLPFFEIATPSSHDELWERLVQHFGSNRDADCFPEIFPANMCIGFTMRLDLLIRHPEYATVLEECCGLFLHMARTTGTLWENKTTSHGSLNHGLALVIGPYLEQAAAGLK